MNVIIKNVFGFLIAMTAVCLTAHAQFAGGTGTEDDPWQITTLAQLDSVRNHTGNSNAPVFYKLMNDLTFSASDDLNAEAPGNFEPVRYFSYSSFDGNGKTISGLVIEKTGSGSYTGLFEEIYSDCYVRNLGLVNCSITSSYSNVGGIAGISVGEITACFVSGTITATGAYAGGIVGHNSGGSINACYNAATVSNPNGGAGGIARSVTNGSIHSCYNIGNVSGKSGSNVGAIVGYVSSSVVTNCYYLTGSGGGNGTQLSETEMKAAAFIDTLNAPFLISYWKAGNSDNNGFPVHVWWNGGTIDYKGETADNPFLITSIPDLNKMRNYIRLKRFWRLENDLDFGNDDYNGEATGNFDPIGGEGFSAAFAGDVEGNNKKITGLKIEQTRTYVGLFGYFIGSIRNLSIENADIKSSLYYVGGFAGSLTGTVENCSFDGTVVSGSMYVGGIAGEIVANNFIRNCTNKGTITGRSDVSGIAGRISSSYGIESHVENCVNEGNIIGTSGGSNISGLTGGTHTSDCRNSGTVYAPECDYVSGLGGGTRCFNEGNVTGRKYVSGLGGGKPSGSYNTGNITGEEFVGGITYAVSAYSTVYWGNAGSGASGSYPSPQIAGCFNIGEVTGKRNVGGISPGKYTSSGSFYIKEKVHSEDHKVIEIEEGAQGITEEQMKSAVVVNAMNVAIHNSFSSLGDHHWHYVSGDIPAYYEPEGGDAPVYTVFLNITPFGVPVEIDGIRFNTKSSGYYSNMKLPEGDYSVKLGDYADATQQSYHVNPSNSTNTLSLNTGITGISDGNGGKIFQLYTPEHVHLMRYANSSSFELMNDITLESQHDFSLTEGNFYSILNFAGSLNGKGHAIRNLTIRGDSLDGVGLFESVSSSRNTGGFDYGWDSRISNLRLENVNIRGYNGVGAIAGYASTGFKSRISRIDSCYVSGVISGVENVGGLTGSSGYSISHCVNEAIVNGQKNVGGITGYSNAHLQLSSNKAEISGVENVGGIAGTTGSSTDSVSNSGKVTGAVNVGGITGYLTQGSIPGTSYSQSGSIRHSYNTGDILLTGSGAVGGIIGTGGEPNNLYSYRTGQLHENYNMGSITATGSGVRAGGIAGYLYTDTIATCYNTGEIKVDDAGSTVGGLVGYHCVSNNYGIISSYNAGKIVTGSVANVGGIAGYVYNTRSGYWPAPVYSPVFTKVYYLKDTDEDINKDIPATGAWAQPIAAFTAYPEAQTVAQLRHPDIVDSLNEVLPEDLWKIDATPNINSGYPILRLESSSGLRSVSPATLNYPVAGGVQKFAVKSNVSWTVAGSESWVAVSPAAGVNNDSVSVTVTANAGEARNATVTVSDGSESLTVTVKQDGQTTDAETPVITTDPQSADYTLGATATPLTVAANAITDGGTLTWQWYSSVSNSYSGGAAISGAISTSYTPPIAAVDTAYYYAIATNTNNAATGAKTASNTSAIARVTVNNISLIAVTNITDVPATVMTNEKLPFKRVDNSTQQILLGTVEPPNATNRTIVWSIKDAGSTGVNIENEVSYGYLDGILVPITTTSSYSAPNSGTFVLTATIVNGTGIGADYTQDFSITVVDVVNAQTPVITTDPISADYTLGATATPLTVAANAITDGGTLTWQWYSSVSNSYSGGAAISGATSTSYTPPIAAVDTAYYYAIATNTNNAATGAKTAADTSAIARVTVNNISLIAVTNITDVPATVMTNEKLPFKRVDNYTQQILLGTVEPPDATNRTIVWSIKDAGSTGVNIANEISYEYLDGVLLATTTSSYSAPNSGTFVLTATIVDGTGIGADYTQDFSITVVDVVNAQTPVISSQPQSATYTVGDAATPLTVSVDALNDGGTLTWQWYSNSANSNSGGTEIYSASSVNYTPPTANAGTTYYYVVVTNINNAAIGAKTAADTSDVAMVTVTKAHQAAPVAVSFATVRTATSITLQYPTDYPERYEFSLDSLVWQESLTFTGLTPNTAYVFYARLRETATHYASPASPPGEPIVTYKAALTGTVTIAGNAVYGDTLTAVTSLLVSEPEAELGKLSYQWYFISSSYNIIDGATDSIYIPTRSDIGRDLYVIVSSANTYVGIRSVNSVTVDKASQPAPVIVLAELTSTSIRLNPVDSISGNIRSCFDWTERWQQLAAQGLIIKTPPAWCNDYSVSEFNNNRLEHNNLAPDTKYIVSLQYLESATHYASELSKLEIVTPAEDEETAPEITVDTLIVNDKDTLSVENGESEYTADCDEEEITVNIGVSLPQVAISISVSGVSYNTQPIPLSLPGTSIDVDINLYYGNRQNIHRLRVNKSIDDSRLLIRRWNDILGVNLNKQTNGGRDISGVKIQNRNNPLSVTNQWYVNTTAPASDFHITINVENKWHSVCSEPATRSLDKVKVYPNPVSVGDNLTLQLPKDYVGGYLNVLTIDGTTVKHKLPLPNTESILSVSDWSPGIYLLNIVGKNGASETVKVIVN